MIEDSQGQTLAKTRARSGEQIEREAGQRPAGDKQRHLQRHNGDQNRCLLAKNAVIEKRLKQQRRQNIGCRSQQQNRKTGHECRPFLSEAPTGQTCIARSRLIFLG
jgi:hypothetical protein